MKLEFNLNQEELDSLSERVAAYNAGSGEPPLTLEQFMISVHCKPFIQKLVEKRYNASLERLGAMFKAKPYQERVAMIQNLESQA